MTIKDIARESGYAISTVSRALNNYPDVSEEARQRIREIVERTGFEPNANARRLKQQKSQSVLFLVQDGENDFLRAVQAAAHPLLSKTGYQMVVHYLEDGQNAVTAAARLCSQHKPRGLYFLGGNTENFKRGFAGISLPGVLATNTSDELQFDNLAKVGVNDRQAAGLAIRTLLAHGHTRIAVIGGSVVTSQVSRVRRTGVEQTLEAAGLSLNPILYKEAAFSFEAGYRAAEGLLAGGQPFTAIFAMSDVQAIGAVRALADAGKRVPQDVSVIGFDGLPITRYFRPRLATLEQPVAQIAATGVELLLDMIGGNAPSRTVELEATLYLGESVADAPREEILSERP